jgi:hypothetical protein
MDEIQDRGGFGFKRGFGGFVRAFCMQKASRRKFAKLPR